MIKLAVFDLDGTLSNTIFSIQHFANAALRKRGLKEASVEDFKSFVGDGAKILINRLLKFGGVEDEALSAEILKEYNDSYDSDPLYLVRPYDGICDMLSDLSEMGIKTAVLSNKPHPTTVQIAEKVFENHRFSAILGQREGFPIKPDPTVLNLMLGDLGIKKEECVYIGDTSTDMHHGKNAGVFTIGVSWGFRDRSDLASGDVIVDHPSEISGIIKRGNADV